MFDTQNGKWLITNYYYLTQKKKKKNELEWAEKTVHLINMQNTVKLKQNM